MDLFVLDKAVISFAKRLMTDSYMQFAILLGLGAFSTIIFQNKSKKVK